MRGDEWVRSLRAFIVVIGQQRDANSSARAGGAGTSVDLGDGVGHDQAAHLTVRDRATAVVLQQ